MKTAKQCWRTFQQLVDYFVIEGKWELLPELKINLRDGANLKPLL